MKKKVKSKTKKRKVVKAKLKKKSGGKEAALPLPYLSAFMSVWGSKV
jgi:hypothetical protein